MLDHILGDAEVVFILGYEIAMHQVGDLREVTTKTVRNLNAALEHEWLSF